MDRIKKITAMIVVCCLAFSLMSCVIIRDTFDVVFGDEEECDHEYGDWKVTKEATCIEKGEKVKTCELCGYEKTKRIALTEHKFDDRHICVYCGRGLEVPPSPSPTDTCTEVPNEYVTEYPTEYPTEIIVDENGYEFISNGDGTCYFGRAYYFGDPYKDVVIPALSPKGDVVTGIGDYAFSHWSGFTSIVIPDSVTSIGVGAFDGCRSLTSIVIPESVTSIGDGAFYGCSILTSIVIPDSVTSIGDGAFYGCSSLTSIVIPDSVTSIGDSAFCDCVSLESVVIPDGVTSIGECVFCNCGSLESVVIPDSVTSIGDGAFYGCSSLESLVIPDSVTSIGACAFYDCNNLTIYCEAISQPSYWDEGWNILDWNGNNCPVVWGYIFED